MKATSRKARFHIPFYHSTALLVCGLVFGLPRDARAVHLSTTNVQGSTASAGWNANIWKTNSAGDVNQGGSTLVGPGVAPAAGNTYSCVSNGVVFSANSQNTIIRNPYVAGQAAVQTFPGDSLTLYPDTEIRFKRIASGNVPICNFPGVGGNPGLILKGGFLNGGDDDTYPITGLIRVDAQSYFAMGNNAGQAPTSAGRRLNISAEITGSGNLVFFNAGGTVSQIISGRNDTYTGQWILKSAWVQFTGINSLGTNSTILVDPLYTLPLDPGIVDVQGPADFEPTYDVNSAGTLTLANNGRMRLHQNCAFTAVTINGNPLSAGKHSYASLVATYPSNFAPGGSGSITVQPYGQLPVVFLTSPRPQSLYPGRTARFTAVAAGPGTVSYQWFRNNQSLADGGKISGATTTNLVIADVSAAEEGSYHCVATASLLTDTSAPATLTVVTPTGEAFENAIIAANAVAYYRLNEAVDPATSPFAFDYMGGGLGNYGVGSQNGFNAIAGPVPTAGLTGFAAANKAAQFANLTANSRVTVSPLNLNTNTVTLTAWVKPSGQQAASAALIYTRGGGSVAGLAFSAAFDAMGNRTLTYNWNNEWETYSWDSGIAPPADQWSFVALVVSPAAATVHVMSPGTLLESTHLYQHEPEAFGGSLLIGDDSLSSDGSRAFSGTVDEVAVFNSALTKAQLVALYAAGVGSVASYAPTIRLQPATLNLNAGQTAIFRVAGGGSDPLTYQWMAAQSGSGSYNNLIDGGRISGATTSMLVISNVSNADQLDYVVRLSNPQGAVTSTPAASILVMPTSPAEQITMAGVLQPGGADWETPNWSDGNPASVSAAMKPGSTYTLMPSGGNNTRLRTPEQPRTAVFPGSVLMVNGTAVFTNNFGAAGETSEIRFKQPNPGRVIFPKLVMNGGQLDAGNDGIIEIGGLIEIRTNAPFYNDGGNDRGYLISAQLTGAGTIEYRAYTGTVFRSNYVNNLNIAGTNNTFSGKWNVVIGTLLATGPGSLGTNDITVGAAGAFQPTYDVTNTNSVLSLSGRMYLHRNHTFKSVFINGTPLSAGTHTFAELNAAYPATFPATWMPMAGATEYTTGSGSLTVLVQPAPTITQQPVPVTKYPSETAVFTVGVSGNAPMFFQWRRSGVGLQDEGNISGANSNTLTIASITSADAGNYDVVVTNSIGSVTSVVATLTLLPTGPALDLTLDFGGAPIVQPTGNDWNTANQWSDGKPASVSALGNPGSIYRVVPGARLRSPVDASYAAFPGDTLTLEGDGVYSPDGASGTIAEIRFKHANPGTNYFKRLVMNGGQIDSGDNGIMVIAGRMDVLANTPIYTDSAAGQDRPYQIDAFLTGNGSIEFQQFSTSFAGNLNITGTSNTYSGIWNIVQGALLGSGLNSLGTGNITIGVNGALETLYDIMSPYATLALDGKMFLHQNDSFKAVTVAGVPLAPGTYTFSQLNTLYPENFPATWPQQLGSSVVTGSGSITVLGNTPPPVNVQFSVSGTGLTLTWPNGILLEADQPTGPWTTNAAATSPFAVPMTQPQKFYRVQTR